MVRELSDAECDAVRVDAQQFLASRPDLSPASLAQYCPTLAESTVRSFIRGNIPGGREVVGQMRYVMKAARAGDILAPGGEQVVTLAEDASRRVRRVAKQGTFYTTETVRKVGQVLDYCAEQCAIGVITAGYGVGKTEAVKAWRRSRRNVECTAFEFDEFASTNKVDFVRCLAKSYGIDTNVGSQNGGLVFRELCQKIRENPGLLIFDQCETLRPRVCQIIRQIHDRTYDTGVGVVMLAAPILLARLTAGKMADLGALTSRVGIWAPLSGLTRAEMAAIVKQEGFADVEEAGFDLWFKAVGGSMRRLMRSLDLLKTKHEGKRVTEKTIAQVAGHLWGMTIAPEVGA
jgi:DNA transposition AAA+ family ATPase